MIILTALAAILKPLSSVKAATSISACSNEVSFKSAAVAKVLATFVPETVVCHLANHANSIHWNWIKNHYLMVHTLFLLAFDIDLASAFVYLEESLS